MGQLKYEKEFSEKLNKREIEPSAGSWEKLQSQLDSTKKKKFEGFKWAGIAAAMIAGIMIIGLLYYNPISETPVVVDTPMETLEPTPQIVEETGNQVPSETEPTPEPQNPPKESPVKQEPSIIAEAEVNKEAVETLNNNPSTDVIEGNNFSKTEDEIAENTTTGKAEVTDAEVDALLTKARAEINDQKTSNVVNVDAKDLLWNVEMEMEQSFREKIFDVLKEGFDKARTAVANRNY